MTEVSRCFRFPFPFEPIRIGKRKRLRLELIAAGRFYDAAVCDKGCQRLTDVAGAHAHGVTHLSLREGCCGAGEDLSDALRARGLSCRCSRWRLVDDLQCKRWRVVIERERQAVGTPSGAMFDAE